MPTIRYVQPQNYLTNRRLRNPPPNSTMTGVLNTDIVYSYIFEGTYQNSLHRFWFYKERDTEGPHYIHFTQQQTNNGWININPVDHNESTNTIDPLFRAARVIGFNWGNTPS